MSTVELLRQPEYTGENRCIPCTMVNVSIAVVASALVALVFPALGVGLFIVSLVVIYLHGYLVPGTPTLTRQYFPDHVLRWFGKAPTASVIETEVEIEPEQVLLDAGAAEPCQDGTDLCLSSEFQTAWREQMEPGEPDDLAAALGASVDDITFDEVGKATVAYVDGTVVGQWGSQAAASADSAAAPELADRYADWERLNPAERARVLMSLRIFIEQCPQCDGAVQIEEEVVESCCRSYDVLASACQSCGDQLFEIEWEEKP